MTPTWANDVPAQAEGITDALDSFVYSVALVPEEVDRNQLTVISGPLMFTTTSLTYVYIKSVADPTDTISLIREDPGILTAGHIITEGKKTTLAEFKGVRPQIVMRC